jgi:hypothetical protein
MQAPLARSLTLGKIFTARWAMALLGEAMNRRQEYATGHKMATFEALKAFLDVANSKDPASYEQAAAALQVSVGAVKTLIYHLRNSTRLWCARRLAVRSQTLPTSAPRFTNFAKL